MVNRARPRKTDPVHADRCKLHGIVNYVKIPMLTAWVCARCVGEGMYREEITSYAYENYPDIVGKKLGA